MMHAYNSVYNSLHITIYSHMYIQTHVDNNTKDYVSSYISHNDHNSTTYIYIMVVYTYRLNQSVAKINMMHIIIWYRYL